MDAFKNWERRELGFYLINNVRGFKRRYENQNNGIWTLNPESNGALLRCILEFCFE
jgi:hypothetical protein